MTGATDAKAATKAAVREVTTAEADELRKADGALVLDVREPDEYEQGAIPGSMHIPRGTLETNIEMRVPDHSTPLVVLCAGGTRSAFAAQTLGQLGYTDVVSMAGGFNRWKDEGRDWRAPQVLTPDQRNRYSRHLLLPEVGEEGQQKLLAARVLLLGAGGLGSPAALYLAAAGVGTLGIVDDDVVDASNLQRQILHNLDRIGDRKVDSAKKTIARPPNIVPKITSSEITSVAVCSYELTFSADLSRALVGCSALGDGAIAIRSRREPHASQWGEFYGGASRAVED